MTKRFDDPTGPDPGPDPTPAPDPDPFTGIAPDSFLGETSVLGRFGDYDLVRPLGSGMMGTVYVARNRTLDKRVALKIALEEGVDTPERFLREVRALAKLEHHNIVRIYHAGVESGRRYVEMELVDGRSLDDLVRAGPVDPGTAARIIEQVARGLEHAHGQGVLHRDIKPSNIIVTPDGVVRVLDFGLARALHESPEERLTLPGTLVGTPYYIAPEQWDGRPVDERCDLYSLGVTFYELLTGRVPFDGSLPEVRQAHLEQAPPRIPGTALESPSSWRDIVERLLEKDPGRRFSSAGTLADALRAARSGAAPPDVPRPAREPGEARPRPGRPASPRPRPQRGFRTPIGVGLLCGLLFAAAASWGWLEGWETRVLDASFLAARRTPPPRAPVVTTIGAGPDEATGRIRTRVRLEDLLRGIEALDALGAGTIGVDLDLSEEPSTPAALQRELEFATSLPESVVPGFVVASQPIARVVPEDTVRRWTVAAPARGLVEGKGLLPPSHAIARRVPLAGHIQVAVDPDGVCRRVPLLLRWEDRVLPSLSLAVVLHHLGLTPGDVEYEPGRAVRLYRDGDVALRIPVDAEGCLLVDFRTSPGALRSTSLDELTRQLAAPGQTEPFDEEEIVFLGADLVGEKDLGAVPGTPLVDLVRVHALAAATMLAGSWVLPAGPLGRVVLIVVASLAAAFLAFHLRPPYAIAGLLLLLGVVWGAGFGLFLRPVAIRLPLASATGAVLGATALSTAFRLSRESRDRQTLVTALSRYVSPEVCDLLVRGQERPTLRVRRKEITLLCVALPEFIDRAETLEPEEIDEFLHTFHERVSRVVFEFGGTIDRFDADGLRALFGDPRPCEDHPARGVRCALDLVAELDRLIADWSGEYRPRFGWGISVHTGFASVGNVGSEERLQYTAVGRQVKVAERMAAGARSRILVGPRTRQLTTDAFLYQAAPPGDAGDGWAIAAGERS